MRIDLTELLRELGNEANIEKEQKVNYPEDGLVLTEPVKVKVHLINIGTSVLLSGTLKTEAELECSRCLKKFRLPVNVELHEEYAKNPYVPAGKKELELSAKDFVYPIEKDNTLDLGETIRQNLLLAVPMKPLCQEKCEGV